MAKDDSPECVSTSRGNSLFPERNVYAHAVGPQEDHLLALLSAQQGWSLALHRIVTARQRSEGVHRTLLSQEHCVPGAPRVRAWIE